MSAAPTSRRSRLMAALTTAVVAASMVGIRVQAAEPTTEGFVRAERAAVPAGAGSGSVQGIPACWLETAASDEVWGVEATVVPEETFYAYGEGWEPSTAIDFTLIELDTGEEEQHSFPSDASGVIGVEFSFNRGFYGSFALVATDSTCEAGVAVEVLPMTDVVDSKFLHDIKWLYLERITTGCTTELFCPDGRVTRGQMATFLSRALGLPTATRDYFTDDETNKHEANINRLRAAGITVGCSATKFCPNGVVTRGQMATFLTRAFDLASTPNDYFDDDETNKHETNINRLRAASITSGCAPTRFCPDGAVTRGQMAAFIHRASR